MTTPNHRKQRANNSREHILDTYVDLLIHTGERAATLDAVATAAKVSKGGLLYHFSSKKALLEALAERTITLAEEDFETMAQAPTPPSRATTPSTGPSSPSVAWRRTTMSSPSAPWPACRKAGTRSSSPSSVTSRLPAPCYFWATACTTTQPLGAPAPARRPPTY